MRLGHELSGLGLAVCLTAPAAACSVPGQAPMPEAAGLRTQAIQQIIQTSQGGISQGISQVSGPGYSYGYTYGPGYSYSYGPGYSYGYGPTYTWPNTYDRLDDYWFNTYNPFNRYSYGYGPGTSSYGFSPWGSSQSSQQTMVFN